MIVLRRRLLFWIVKEYIKRWRKIILVSFLLGILFFFILYFFSGFLISKVPIGHKETIGIVGDYTPDTIPQEILKDVSVGLTTFRPDYALSPGLASSYSIKNNNKTYEFHLKRNIRFSDGTLLTSDTISYQFSDVAVNRPNHETITFSLKEAYAPFLVKVAYPVFKKGFVGVGAYRINDIEINNTFVKKITLVSNKNRYDIKLYKFYPTEEALKLAFVLGEVSKITGVVSIKFQNTQFTSFPKLRIEKKTNYQKLVSLFYNYRDPTLSDKRLRQALAYAVPESFERGERSYYSYPKNAWYFETTVNESRQDVAHAKLLISASSVASSGASLKLEIKTLPQYKKDAEIIAKSWEDLNVKIIIKVVNTVPESFQIFLGDFSLSQDPDQYSLWHSNLNNNITQYNNLRIDSLLENGRRTIDLEARRKIYADFQKYLLDDPPASFLYFPYEYEITRM